MVTWKTQQACLIFCQKAMRKYSVNFPDAWLKMGVKTTSACVLCSLAIAATSEAAIIGMEDIAPSMNFTTEAENSSRVINGFKVFLKEEGGHYVDSAYHQVGNNWPSNGTDWLLINLEVSGVTSDVRISPSAGGVFSLQSLDATEHHKDFSGSNVITVKGTQSGGAILATSFTTTPRAPGITPTFQTFTLSSAWVNLTEVTILQAQGTMALDNVRVNEPSVGIEPSAGVVPEPATLTIWGLGALGFAIAAYRRRRVP